MLYLDNFSNMKLYRNKKFLYSLANEKKKYTGNVIFLDTKDIQESSKIINNSLISNKYTRCYYIPKNNIALIKNVKKKKLINQNKYYQEVRNSCKDILKTYLSFDKYEGLSCYYDISELNNLFFDNVVASDKLKANYYKTFITNILSSEESFELYSNKIVICTLNKNKYKDFNSFISKNNEFLSIFYNTVYLNIDTSAYGNLTILVLGEDSKRFFKFNANTIIKKNLNSLKRLINIIIKLENGIKLDEDEENEDIDDTSEPDIELKESASNKKMAKDIIASTTNVKTKKEQEIFMKIDEKIDEMEEPKSLTTIENDINNNKEFLDFLEELKNEKISAENSKKNTARNQLLKEEEKKIRINQDPNNKTFEEIMNEITEKTIKKEDLPIIGKNSEILKESTLRDFEKSYNDNLDIKDKLEILKSFSENNMEIKLYVRNIKKEDTSNAFTKKETWTIDIEDSRRVRHTIKVDFPIFINDKFLYIEGNKKVLNKQLLLLPVVKNKPDVVQIVTNSKKTFLYRFGNKISPKMERFKKLIVELEKNKKLFDYKIGNNTKSNKNYLTNIEYDELASNYMYFKIDNTVIYFNQEEIRQILKEKKISLNKNKRIVPIGLVNDSEPIFYDMESNILIYNGKEEEIDIVDYIILLLNQKDKNVMEKYKSINVSKNYIYTRCKILNRNIPLILFLAYNEGLSSVLHKAKINYELSNTRKVLSNTEKDRKGCIPFKDNYLYYDLYPISNSLLLNALMEINTKDYDFEMFNSKEVYLELFLDLYGTRTIAKGFDNFFELFIDGITKEVLEDLNYPTTVSELLLYGNKLLEDNDYVPENDMSNYRLRSNEVINAIFYQCLEQAYITYKNSVNGANPIKISIPQDKIIKELQSSAILQDYNTLNPIKEADSISSVTYKGPSGLNSDDAYTLEKRAYSDSMMGILAASSTTGNTIGANRTLTYNANVLSNRGYLKPNVDNDDLNMGNLLSSAEMSAPLVANHDSPMRVNMLTAQSKQTIPTVKSNKLLITNGSEQSLAHSLGTDFIFTAKEDGTVIDYDEKSEMMCVEYKSGKKDIIDLSRNTVKNGGGGFYLINKLDSELKVGDKFKKNDVLAKNVSFFKDSINKKDAEFSFGRLAKIAIYAGDFTHEDSCLVTEGLCEDLTSKITMKKEKVLGKNANVDFIVKKGQKIKTGDPLLVFEQGFEEEEINMMLSKIADELQEEITKMSKNQLISKYTGVIDDIKIYHTCDIKDMSPSLQKIVKSYNSEITTKEKLIKKYYENINQSNIILPPKEKIEAKNDKVKGTTMPDSVMIEFYITYEDELGVGDKIAYYTALKSVISTKIPHELAPYSDFRKDEEISAIMSYISVNARMTTSIYLSLYGNKVLIELKKKIEEIWNK